MAGTLLRTDWQNTVKDELSKHAQGLYETAQRGLQIVQDVPRPDPNEVLQQLQSHVEQVAQPVQDVVQFGQQQAQQVQQQLQDYATGLTQMPQPLTAGGAEPFVQSRQETAPIAGAEPAGGSLQDYARQAAQKAGVDPEIFVRQIQQESGFNPRAGSPAGAQGIAQIMPQYHNVDTSDPYASLDYAANLMRSHLATYGGDYGKALAAYNAGPGAVAKYGGIPPFEETERYVRTIMGGAGEVVRGAVVAARDIATDAANKWTTQFDFGSTYTGAYRTGTPHRGIDLVPQKGGIGTAVQAFAPGTVTHVQRDSGGAGGLMVYVRDPDGLTHAYMHLQGADVQVGDQVARGQRIATMGESGTEGSPHLHYEVRRGLSGDPLNQLIDPRPYMRGQTGAEGGPQQAPGEPTNMGMQARAPLYAGESTDQQAASVGQPFGIVGDVVDRGRRAVQQVVANLQEQPPDQAVSPVPAPGFGYDPSNIRPVEPPPDLPRRQDVRDLGIPPQPTIFQRAGEQVGRAVQELPESGLADQLLRSGRTRAEQAEYGVRQQEELERMLAQSRARQNEPLTAGDVAGAAIEGVKSLLPFGPGQAPGPQNVTAPRDIAETRERINRGIEQHPAFQDWPVPVAAGVGIMATQMLLDPLTYTTWAPLLRAGASVGGAVTQATGREWLGKLSASAVTNGLQNALYEAQRPDADPLEVGKQFALGAGLGSGLEFGVPALVKAGRAIMGNVDQLGPLLRARQPAEAEAGFAMGLPTGGRNAPEPPMTAPRRPAAGRQRLPNYQVGTPEHAFEQIARPLRESSDDGLLHLDLNTLPKEIMPVDAAGGAGLVKLNPGRMPHSDDLRGLFEANEVKRDFYYDQSDQGVPTVGPDNLEEWFALNAVMSQRTGVTTQVREAIDMIGTVRQVAKDGRAAGKTPPQIRADILKAVNDFAYAGPSGPNKRIGATRGYATGVSETGGIKTPTFAGNYGSAESRLYDPGITNDIHNWRAMNIDSFGTGEKDAANNPTLYRTVEAIFNELGAEQGVDGLAFQSAVWDGIRAMQNHAPAAWKDWQAGNFQKAIADAKAAGVFNRTTQTAGAPEPGEISRAMQAPGVKAALARWGDILKEPLPPELGISSVVRTYPGEVGKTGLPKKGQPPIRPASLPFRQGERAIAEASAPVVRGISGDVLEQLGVDERGIMPWLATSHRVIEETPGQYVVHLPAGNVDTARYVAAEVGRSLNAPEMRIHYPDYRAPEPAGLKLVGTEDEVRAVQQVLSDAGHATVRGPTGRSLQIPLYDNASAESIVRTLTDNGVSPSTLTRYNGANERVPSGDYDRIVGQVGGRFEPTTAGRRGLLERTRGPVAEESAAADAFTAPGGAEPPGGVRGARGEANLPLSLNLGGAAAGGYAGSAATPEDAPLEERLRNIGIGATAGLLGTRAITRRMRPQLAPARATEGFRAPGAPVAREAAEGVLQARTRGPGGASPTSPPTTPSASGQYRSVMPEGAFKEPPAAPVGQRLEAARRRIVRDWFDRKVDLNTMQQEYAKALKRPLTADEMMSELSRLDASAAAQVRNQQGLRPAIQSVGRDYDALKDYVTLKTNVDIADALGNDQRMFSGGLTKADSQQALLALEQQLGPERFKRVQDAADQVFEHSRINRQTLVDSGILSPEQALEMEAKYPDWVKTRILQYQDSAEGGARTGGKIGLSSRDVHAYTREGTIKAREDPIASTAAYTHQVESMARKNDAFNALIKIDAASPTPQLRRVASDFSPTKNQVTVQGYGNGEKVKYVTDNVALGEAINGAEYGASIPNWTTTWARAFRAMATSRNPVFLAGNAALDIPQYVLTSSAREGGPQALPRVVVELGRGYADAFRGISSGTFEGTGTQRFLREGGGQSGFFMQSTEDAAKAVQELRRPHVFAIHSKTDLLNRLKDVALFKPVEAIGERIEMGPRVAAMRLAERRGANVVQATIEGRTVTVDFAQGGRITKLVNSFIPFFNVAFQGPAQVARTFGANKAAFAATITTLIGVPTVAAEAWNRSDPQRAKDYADVPQYIKDQGVVIMLPTEAPLDKDGNRRPQYLFVNLRNWSVFSSTARAAAERVAQDDARSWQEVLGSVATGASPFKVQNVSDLTNMFALPIPGVTTAGQLAINRDLYRDRAIVTERNDEQASETAKAVTPFLQAVMERVAPGEVIVRPSAVDFAIRDTFAGIGGMVLGGGDIVAGKPARSEEPSAQPLVGGLTGRFVQGRTGEQMHRASEERMTPGLRRIFADAGMPNYEVSAMDRTARIGRVEVPLLQHEQADAQKRMNQVVQSDLQAMAADPKWSSFSLQRKQELVSSTISRARRDAERGVVEVIPDTELRRRLDVAEAKKGAA